MPYPRWLAQVNKRIFNPRALKAGKYPVVAHKGRSSGTLYRTPMDAFPTKDGYVLVVRYGPGSDWVQNILRSGSAVLIVDGEETVLTSPRLTSQDSAVAELRVGTEPKPDFYKAEHYLLMDQVA